MTSKPTTIFCFLGRKYNKQHIRGKIFDMRMRKFSGIMSCMLLVAVDISVDGKHEFLQKKVQFIRMMQWFFR